jgi:katanin p80 WD40 repeat-containing subunit B1
MNPLKKYVIDVDSTLIPKSIQMMRHVFEKSGIKGTIAAVIKLPDNAVSFSEIYMWLYLVLLIWLLMVETIQVQADVVSALKGKLDLFNLEIFSSFLPVLVGLLSSKTER